MRQGHCTGFTGLYSLTYTMEAQQITLRIDRARGDTFAPQVRE
jgi:hypothetical protein